MVTTRWQSQTIEPPALPPVAPPKRKRSNVAHPAPSTAQVPDRPSTKRRKKVKSTAKIDLPAATPRRPATSAGKVQKPATVAAKRKARRPTAQANGQAKKIEPTKSDVPVQNSWRSIHLDSVDDPISSGDEASRPPQSAALQDADDEDADSRYALGSKRKGSVKKPLVPTTRRTAELRFEEDGLEEVDKSQVALADAVHKTSTQKKQSGPKTCTTVSESDGKNHRIDMLQASGEGAEMNKENLSELLEKGKGKTMPVQRKYPSAGVPSKVVMFTIVEAIATLALYQDGTTSMAAEIDPESRQPYTPLQTGEYLSYPVKGNYHLGALGRYGVKTIPAPPFALTVPLSEHSFVESTATSSTAATSRHGLGFTAPPLRPRAPTTRRPNNYCFTFGRYRGRRVDSVPIEYLRSIFEGDEYYADAKLQQAFTDLYPKGLYESETESFVFEKGGFKGKRLDEVPKSYLWGLIRKKGTGVEVGGKKGRKALERALDVWEKKQLDFTKD